MSAIQAQVQKMASELEQPAQNILDKGQEYASQLMEVDPSVSAMFEMIEAFPEGEEECLEEFFEGIDKIYYSSKEGVETLNELLETLRPFRDISRNLRKPINKIERGLRSIADAHDVIEEWYTRKEKYLEENEVEFE